MKLKKYIPTILSASAAVGVVVTAVTAIKRTPKAIDILNSLDAADTKVTKFDKVKAVIPTYLPTIIAGVSTIALIFSADITHKKVEAALAASCMTLEKAFEIKRENARKPMPLNDVDEVNTLFIEDFFTMPIVAKAEDVIEAEEKLNELFHKRGFATLGDFYELLGVADKAEIVSPEFGWSIFMGDDQGYTDIVFNHETFIDETCGKDGDVEYTLITYEHEPVLNFMEPLWDLD